MGRYGTSILLVKYVYADLADVPSTAESPLKDEEAACELSIEDMHGEI